MSIGFAYLCCGILSVAMAHENPKNNPYPYAKFFIGMMGYVLLGSFGILMMWRIN